MKELQKINCSDLSLGMRFSSPVFFDDGENMFLAEGKPIREYHLDALRRWKQSYVVTYGQILSDNALSAPDSSDMENLEELEELEELDDLEEVEILEELDAVSLPQEPEFSASKTVAYRSSDDSFESVYQRICAISRKFFTSFERGEPLSRSAIDQATESICNTIRTDGQSAVIWILNKGSGATLEEQAVDGAFLCAAVAARMSVFPRKITQIVQAALIHDIAMVQVPSVIRKKAGALTIDEFELLKMHTVRSARFCKDQLLFPREVADIVVSHHEKWDGSGYPEGREGNEIDLGARIIAVIDAFESMTSDKAYRDPLSSYETVQHILTEGGKAFDSMVVKSFVQTFGVYPAGSYVQLSDGAVCRVVETEGDALFLPTVTLVRRGKGPTAIMREGENIRLNMQRQLFVAKAVESPE